MEEPDLVEKLKSHLRFEEGMDNSLLSFYIDNAKDYVTKATGS